MIYRHLMWKGGKGMFKKRKELEINALQILILTLISIIIGIFGIIVFSILMLKEEKNIIIIAILLTVSALSIFLSIAFIIAFLALKIEKKREFKELFKLTFDIKSDIFKMSESIIGTDIITIVLLILSILIY